jgi:hypothetical protein
VHAPAKSDIGECQAIRDAISHRDLQRAQNFVLRVLLEMLKPSIPYGFFAATERAQMKSRQFKDHRV